MAKVKRITSFEEACKIEGYDPIKVLPDVSGMPEHFGKASIAFAKLCIINPVLNRKDGEDWVADWSEGNSQPKYYVWYNVVEDDNGGSGFALSFYDVLYGSSGSALGSCLYYRDAETARYAFDTFKELHEDMVLVKKLIKGK